MWALLDFLMSDSIVKGRNIKVVYACYVWQEFGI